MKPKKSVSRIARNACARALFSDNPTGLIGRDLCTLGGTAFVQPTLVLSDGPKNTVLYDARRRMIAKFFSDPEDCRREFLATLVLQPEYLPVQLTPQVINGVTMAGLARCAAVGIPLKLVDSFEGHPVFTAPKRALILSQLAKKLHTAAHRHRAFFPLGARALLNNCLVDAGTSELHIVGLGNFFGLSENMSVDVPKKWATHTIGAAAEILRVVPEGTNLTVVE